MRKTKLIDLGCEKSGSKKFLEEETDRNCSFPVTHEDVNQFSKQSIDLYSMEKA